VFCGAVLSYVLGMLLLLLLLLPLLLVVWLRQHRLRWCAQPVSRRGVREVGRVLRWVGRRGKVARSCSRERKVGRRVVRRERGRGWQCWRWRCGVRQSPTSEKRSFSSHEGGWRRVEERRRL